MSCEKRPLRTGLTLLVICLSVQLFTAGKVRCEEGASDAGETLDVLALGETVPTVDLGSISGRQNLEIDEVDLQMSNAQLDAQMGGNVLFSNTTGVNTVTNDAFSNAQGIATVIQNSGNQVIINNALIVNMALE